MAIRARHQGFIGELFSLLSHPTMVALTSVILVVSAVMDYTIDHPLFQFSATFLIASLLASTLTASRSEAPINYAMVGVVGLVISSIGLVRNVNSIGEVTLQPRQTIEAYQRGRATPVDHHLGGPLAFDIEQSQVRFKFNEEPRAINYQRFVEGEPLQVGPWIFRLLNQRGDMNSPSVTLKFKHRTTKKIETHVLCLGESKLVGDQMVVRMDQVLNNPPKSDQASNLQVALYAQWKDSDNQTVQKPIYLQSIFPELDERFGQSPYVMTIEGVKPTPKLTLSVQKASQNQIFWAGVVVLLLALLMLFQDTVNAQQAQEETAAA